MRHQPWAAFLALAISAMALPAHAQVPTAYLVGAVRDSVAHIAVAGAVVSVLDAAGTVSARRLSNERGEYRIPLRAGDTHVRVIRIGFEPRDLAVPPRASGDVRLDVTLLALSTMMRRVRILGNTSCPSRTDAPQALGLWEQAQDGLLATVVARQQNPAAVVRLISERVFNGNTDQVRTLRVRVDSSVDTISFVAARSAQDFVRHGFEHDSANRRTYFGPDAIVLLSDAFATSYCFRVDSGGAERRRQVGIHFAPAVRRRDRLDIDGTLWIDTVARELRDVEFRYLGVPDANEQFKPGGRVSFMTMRNGIVLVDGWTIRSVNTVTVERMGIVGGIFQPTRQTTRSAVELGGQLARASWPDGLHWNASLGALRAHATRGDGTPAVNLRVTLEGTPYAGITDSSGIVMIRDLLPGPYAVQIADPRLDTLQVTFPSPLLFRARADTVTEGSFAVPTLESFAKNACVAANQMVDDSASVLGRVMTTDGKPVRDALVTFTSRAHGVDRHHPESVVTGADGFFESCVGWHPTDKIVLRVSRDGAKDVEVVDAFDARIAVVRINIDP
jgi:Carboxypeptidase regulatory-like domain